ncbi:MAG: copper resistance protein NlpE [Desulfovibrionaceae bacterium]|nr:copper resistance protein NlpE [Desulfovibrionaceae bacterium]
MKLLPVLIVLLGAAGATSCAAEKSSVIVSEASLEGTYKGVLPCADCSGILTQVLLSGDGSAVITSQYEGKGDAVFTDQGAWYAKNGMITVTAGSETLHYRVLSASRIMLVNADGQASASMPEAYILTKTK